MKQVNQQTIEFLFLKMAAHFSRWLPQDPRHLEFMKSQYYEELKDYSEELIFANLKRHIKESNFMPTVADLCKVDEEKDLLEKSLIESQKYISMIEEEERNIKPKSEEELQKIKELKEKMNQLQRDGRKRYDERIAKLFEQ